MELTRRFKLLLIVLTTLIVFLVIDGDSPTSPKTNVVNAVPTSPRSRDASFSASLQSDKPSTILLVQAREEPLDTKETNAFPTRDWTPPPPPPPPAPLPLPPAPPQAPPIPFIYLGKINQDKQWSVFLGQQDRTYSVIVGDKIGHEYKVESIAPPVMTLLYLPLKQSQSISIGFAE